MSAFERMPLIAGWVTLAIGAGLVAAPGRVSGQLGLHGREPAVRALGVADLVLVPGLLRGRPRWPWMAARAALNIADAAYLRAAAPHSSAPGALNTGVVLLAGLTAADGAAALALWRAGT
jgi:hypothetical protein